jgi:hypothetical protein
MAKPTTIKEVKNHRRITPLLLTTTLALILSGSLALAKPRQAPPLSTYLTPVERVCESRGRFALTVGRARDNGMTRLTAIAISRSVQAKDGLHPAYQSTFEAIIHVVYDFPAHTPVWFQHAMETACLKAEQGEPTQDDTHVRY